MRTKESEQNKQVAALNHDIDRAVRTLKPCNALKLQLARVFLDAGTSAGQVPALACDTLAWCLLFCADQLDATGGCVAG